MANVKEKVYVETENIIKVLVELEKVKDEPNMETVVLVGIGGYLQNIYTGMENILKQLLLHKNISIPDTVTWHKDLLNLATRYNFITKETRDKIDEYRLFRHFFAHAYGFIIDEAKLKPLRENISDIFLKFKREIEGYLLNVEE